MSHSLFSLTADGAAHAGKPSGGDLSARTLQVTAGPLKVRKRPLGMPACVAACETEDGRLALLFADAHVRVVELRPDILAVQETLFESLDGRNNFEEQNNDEDTDDNDDEDDEDDEQEEQDREGKGKGKGKSSKRAGKGKSSQQGGKGKHSRRIVQARVDEVLRKARKMAKQAVDAERSDLQIDNLDDGEYDELKSTVESEIGQLRTVLQAVEAKEKEKAWLHGKTVGELDDTRLVSLAVGEKNVYNRRGLRDQAMLSQRLPKRLSFVVDVSGSMAHFNSDLRLDRLCGAVVMIMEALYGLEHKYCYEVVGHSGETAWLPLVMFDHPPRDRAERLSVVHRMVDHASRCRSGDNTLAAGSKAISDIVRQDADDYFVFLISDANLEGYGVSADALTAALMSNPVVHSHVVFISEPHVAEEMQLRMPHGRAHCVLDNEELPLLLKDLFSRALLNSSSKL